MPTSVFKARANVPIVVARLGNANRRNIIARRLEFLSEAVSASISSSISARRSVASSSSPNSAATSFWPRPMLPDARGRLERRETPRAQWLQASSAAATSGATSFAATACLTRLARLRAHSNFFARFWIAVWLIECWRAIFNDRELPGAIFALNGFPVDLLAGFRHYQL